ncbi:unnamed protein product [Adineta ricciae]|uniref:Uncharacterized protein n=1 Tax=Adineta ricciae TaxID=249248 RepID=A0A816BUB7_ADIRI|nr:unnamed protein product [Adineta ricciae]
MGGGGSKKPKQVNEPPVQKLLPPPLEQPKRDVSLLSLPRAPPTFSPVEEERPRISPVLRPITPANVFSVREKSFHKSGDEENDHDDDDDDDSDDDEDDDERPSTSGQRGKPKSRATTKVTTPSPIPLLKKRASVASSTTTTTSTHSDLHRAGSSTHKGELGRYCSHCPHCQRRSPGKNSIVAEKTPVWLTKRPKREGLTINMDNYDADAIHEKVIALNGHIPGSYDYQPQLTIALTKDKNEFTKENYFTLPFVVKTVPGVAPACTPFPNYKILERNERRINKPYTLPLFTD